MTTREVLLGAADLLERKGWCQNALARDKGGREVDTDAPDAASFCALGAIVVTQRYVGGGALFALERHLRVGSVVDWNNARGRTKQEVIAAMRAAAEAK